MNRDEANALFRNVARLLYNGHDAPEHTPEKIYRRANGDVVDIECSCGSEWPVACRLLNTLDRYQVFVATRLIGLGED